MSETSADISNHLHKSIKKLNILQSGSGISGIKRYSNFYGSQIEKIGYVQSLSGRNQPDAEAQGGILGLRAAALDGAVSRFRNGIRLSAGMEIHPLQSE